MNTSVWLCPECVHGKHENCDGKAWDFDNDRFTDCECEVQGHEF